jgi:membrane protein YqaA with SNARE-associated domain
VTDHLIGVLGLYGGTLVVCFLSGLIPVINAELFLVGVSKFAVSSPTQLPGVVIAAAVGQMTAKVILYYAGMGLVELPRGRFKTQIEKARGKLASWQKRPYFIMAVSACFGLPPFLLVSIVAGALGIRFRAFAAIGLVGRALRFGFFAVLPWI